MSVDIAWSTSDYWNWWH